MLLYNLYVQATKLINVLVHKIFESIKVFYENLQNKNIILT
jgi:hypothetical protein